MNFGDVKLLYMLSCAVLCVVILSPTLMMVVSFPGGERFSELWILGPNHMAENYPFNVAAGEIYSMFLGISNHVGDLEYYAVRVKLRNQTEPFTNSNVGLPSILEPIFEYRVFLRDNETWEKMFSFSFDDVSFNGNFSRVSSLFIDGHSVDVNKVAVWDAEKGGFFYQLFFELWIYNVTTSSFEFHNRSVGLWLNISRPL